MRGSVELRCAYCQRAKPG
ncbi:hypothetical protein EKA85_03955 [Pseudomonas veronii]|nr:hypothetical protein EKA85_03955 [Pseudomonas veronii]